MSEKAKFASISIMNLLKELNLSAQEIPNALSLAWCGTITATYKMYERGVKEKEIDAVEGMTWEEFIRLNLDQLKERCEKMRSENEALRF
jgi:hypothetical protein